MKISGIIWLDRYVEKIASKHHVTPDEVAEVFDRKPHFRFTERGHRKGEDLYAAMGRTGQGRYLVVFFVYKPDHRALVVSARDMDQAERRYYGKT